MEYFTEIIVTKALEAIVKHDLAKLMKAAKDLKTLGHPRSLDIAFALVCMDSQAKRSCCL